MVKIRTCSFCGEQIQPGEGVMYIMANGTIYYFCSTKCKKFKLEFKKNPRHIRWTTHWDKKAK